uniref:Uncharacterized protein n=1 Tax=Chromera velia CCMP2878 TaxID=1169474 RepID=A0A0G4F8M4_9ALVE|eukprot:Cvel_15738.t1-p1 / transcript=Cvel_15738.t1 / gene=Cvel_15738 / organism=Chromera_velia_CCMP2878 / gene_product=hypothetical protein / transcript_product=hypothetical protein / location=Cvel_scaffold1177:34038-43746(+) / protein_length=1324 / sequence_SO=supercontig / SO=protein_coding / is_pseudo=false
MATEPPISEDAVENPSLPLVAYKGSAAGDRTLDAEGHKRTRGWLSRSRKLVFTDRRTQTVLVEPEKRLLPCLPELPRRRKEQVAAHFGPFGYRVNLVDRVTHEPKEIPRPSLVRREIGQTNSGDTQDNRLLSNSTPLSTLAPEGQNVRAGSVLMGTYLYRLGKEWDFVDSNGAAATNVPREKNWKKGVATYFKKRESLVKKLGMKEVLNPVNLCTTGMIRIHAVSILSDRLRRAATTLQRKFRRRRTLVFLQNQLKRMHAAASLIQSFWRLVFHEKRPAQRLLLKMGREKAAATKLQRHWMKRQAEKKGRDGGVLLLLIKKLVGVERLRKAQTRKAAFRLQKMWRMSLFLATTRRRSLLAQSVLSLLLLQLHHFGLRGFPQSQTSRIDLASLAKSSLPCRWAGRAPTPKPVQQAEKATEKQTQQKETTEEADEEELEKPEDLPQRVMAPRATTVMRRSMFVSAAQLASLQAFALPASPQPTKPRDRGAKAKQQQTAAKRSSFSEPPATDRERGAGPNPVLPAPDRPRMTIVEKDRDKEKEGKQQGGGGSMESPLPVSPSTEGNASTRVRAKTAAQERDESGETSGETSGGKSGGQKEFGGTVGFAAVAKLRQQAKKSRLIDFARRDTNQQKDLQKEKEEANIQMIRKAFIDAATRSGVFVPSYFATSTDTVVSLAPPSPPPTTGRRTIVPSDLPGGAQGERSKQGGGAPPPKAVQTHGHTQTPHPSPQHPGRFMNERAKAVAAANAAAEAQAQLEKTRSLLFLHPSACDQLLRLPLKDHPCPPPVSPLDALLSPDAFFYSDFLRVSAMQIPAETFQPNYWTVAVIASKRKIPFPREELRRFVQNRKPAFGLKRHPPSAFHDFDEASNKSKVPDWPSNAAGFQASDLWDGGGPLEPRYREKEGTQRPQKKLLKKMVRSLSRELTGEVVKELNRRIEGDKKFLHPLYEQWFDKVPERRLRMLQASQGASARGTGKPDGLSGRGRWASPRESVTEGSARRKSAIRAALLAAVAPIAMDSNRRIRTASVPILSAHTGAPMGKGEKGGGGVLELPVGRWRERGLTEDFQGGMSAGGQSRTMRRSTLPPIQINLPDTARHDIATPPENGEMTGGSLTEGRNGSPNGGMSGRGRQSHRASGKNVPTRRRKSVASILLKNQTEFRKGSSPNTGGPASVKSLPARASQALRARNEPEAVVEQASFNLQGGQGQQPHAAGSGRDMATSFDAPPQPAPVSSRRRTSISYVNQIQSHGIYTSRQGDGRLLERLSGEGAMARRTSQRRASGGETDFPIPQDPDRGSSAEGREPCPSPVVTNPASSYHSPGTVYAEEL